MLFNVHQSLITRIVLLLALFVGVINSTMIESVQAAIPSHIRDTSIYGVTILEGSTISVSVDSNNIQGNGFSYLSSISADGRYVAFQSGATNLVAGDTNGVEDIFLYDLQAGATTRISVDTNGVQGNNASGYPFISPSGRYITFASSATNLVPDDTNSSTDIFVHDQQTGLTSRVSIDSNGQQANNVSSNSTISSDGRYVAFTSSASNLAQNDTNGVDDIFVHDQQTGLTTRVSVNSSGAQANLYSDYQSISADGRFVAFHSSATNLVQGDTNGTQDVFMHDIQTGTTTRISVASSGTQANNQSLYPFISSDGHYVMFHSNATNLVSGDTNAKTDIFKYDTWTSTITRVSINSSGVQANGNSTNSSITPDGRYITFYSSATNLVPNDTNSRSDVFIYDAQAGITARISIDSNGLEANGNSQYPSISADGSLITFTSSATNLVQGDTNSASDIFVHRNNFQATPVVTATSVVTSTPLITSTSTPVATNSATVMPSPSTRTPTYTPTTVSSLFQPYISFSVGNGEAVGIGDFNNDGLQDVALTALVSGVGKLFVFVQSNDGTLANPISYAAGYQPFSLAVGDLNHDRRSDIVVTNMSSNEISVFLQQEDGNLAPRTTYSTGTGKLAVAVGDLNNDGFTDVAVSGNDIGIFTQNANGTLNSMVTYPAPGSPTAVNDIAIADVNNDGKNDVIKKHGYPAFVVYLQKENGALSSGLSYPTDTPCQPLCDIKGITTGDVTGDGLTDIVTSFGGNRPDSRIAVFAQTGDGSLQAPVMYSAYDIPQAIEVADINQDNHADVLIAHAAWSKVSAFLQQGNGALTAYTLFPVPYADYTSYGLSVGDINQDGLPDLAIADYNRGLVILYHSPSSLPNPPTPTHVPTYTPTFTPTPKPANTATSVPTFTPTFTQTPVTQSIPLLQGWNLVSFNVRPTDTSISSVLSSIEGNYDLVYAWDASGAHASSGNWLKADNVPASPDSLTSLNEAMGFWVHMTAADTLEVVGTVPQTTNVSLLDNAGGWNLVAYPSNTTGGLPTILSEHGVGIDFSLVYAYHPENATDPWKLYDKTAPPIVNDLAQLVPGFGYWIKVNADRTWVVEYGMP